MKSVQLGSAIAANLVTSAVATARLKALKQWVLSFLTLEKPRNSDLSDALREKLIMLFDAEYNLLGKPLLLYRSMAKRSNRRFNDGCLGVIFSLYDFIGSQSFSGTRCSSCSEHLPRFCC